MLKQRVNVGGNNKHNMLIGANAHMKYALFNNTTQFINL